jgi:hypothetical protein
VETLPAVARLDPSLEAIKELRTTDTAVKTLAKTDTEGWMAPWEILALEGLFEPHSLVFGHGGGELQLALGGGSCCEAGGQTEQERAQEEGS